MFYLLKFYEMDKKQIIQLLSDASVQIGETYEMRSIMDSDFDLLADAILRLHEISVKELKDENYDLHRFYEDKIQSGDR